MQFSGLNEIHSQLTAYTGQSVHAGMRSVNPNPNSNPNLTLTLNLSLTLSFACI